MDAETARKAHTQVKRKSPQDLRIYTDGSGISGQIGASAYAPQVDARLKKHLGTDK